MTIHIIGGTYKEYCASPNHLTMQGSAGRAALCLSQIDPSIHIELHARISEQDKVFLEEVFAFTNNCKLNVTDCSSTTKFEYFHPLSEPKITPSISWDSLPEFDLTNQAINQAVIFGMIEATPVVNCKVAIYDPQNTYNPKLFTDTGSTAETLI